MEQVVPNSLQMKHQIPQICSPQKEEQYFQGLKDKLNELNVPQSPEDRQIRKNKKVSKILIDGQNPQRGSGYDRSMNSTPDRQNEMIGQAIGINVKSKDVGTGYVAGESVSSPSIKSRPHISTGETHLMKMQRQPQVGNSQQDIKMYLKHNRQYSTISKRYGDSENAQDLKSHRILQDKPRPQELNRMSVTNVKNQSLEEFVNIVSFPNTQESPETSYRIAKEYETANFHRHASSQQITIEEQQEMTQEHQQSHDRSKEVIIMSLKKSLSGTQNITAQPSNEQFEFEGVTVKNNDDGKDTKFEDNKLEEFEQMQPEPIYQSNKNLVISPEQMKYPNGIYVKTKKFQSSVLHSQNQDKSNSTTIQNRSPVSPATGLSHNDPNRHSNHFKISFNKPKKSKASKVSPNADLGSVQVGAPQSQKQLRQKFIKFQKEVKNNFNDVMNQMAQLNQFRSIDMAQFQQRGIATKKVEFSFENPVPLREGTLDNDQSIETSKSRSRGRNLHQNSIGSPSEPGTFSPRSTFGSQGFGTTMYNSSYYKKNKLNSQYTSNMQRPQGLTTAPQRTRRAIKRPQLTFQKQMNIDKIAPKYYQSQQNDSKLRVHSKKVVFESKRPTYEQAHGLLIDEKVIKEGMEMLLNQEQKMTDYVMRYGGPESLMYDSQDGSSVEGSPDREEFKQQQPTLNQIVLEEDQVRSKLQDDKSSQLLSEWDPRNQSSPNNNASKQQKGIHGIPVLKLYGKKLTTTEKSIDIIQNEHNRLKTEGSDQNIIAQYGHTEDVRQRDSKFMSLSNVKGSFNDANAMDSTTLYKLNVPEVHMTHIGEKFIAGTKGTVKQPKSRDSQRAIIQASVTNQGAVFSRNSLSSRKRSMLSILSQHNSSDRDSPHAKKMLKEKANKDLDQIYEKHQLSKKKYLRKRKRSSQFIHEDGLLMVESMGMSMQSSQGVSSQVNLQSQKKHFIPVGIPDPLYKMKKSIDQQQLDSFQLEPIPYHGQKQGINVPELSYWKPLSSNRILKSKKDVKIKIIEGPNMKQKVSTNVSSQIAIGKDAHLNSQCNEISMPMSRNNSKELLDPQFKRMHALQEEFESLFKSCFQTKQLPSINPQTMVTVKSNKPQITPINPSKPPMNQTSGEFVKKSNTDLFQVNNLDVDKIETELLKLNVIEDSVKRLPFRLLPESANQSERCLAETEIKNISEMRVNTFSQNKNQIPKPVSESLNENSTCSQANQNQNQLQSDDRRNPMYKTATGAGENHFSQSPFMQDEFNPAELSQEEIFNLYQTFELLKRLEVVQGQIPFQNIDARKLLEGGAKELKVPTQEQLEGIRAKLIEINKQVEALNYNAEVQVHQSAGHMVRGALTSRKISPAKLAAKIERQAFDPSNNNLKKISPLRHPQTVKNSAAKNSSMTNQRYTFGQLKKFNRERLEQSMLRKRKKGANSPVIDKTKIKQIDRTQGISLDHKPKRQALLFKGVLKKQSKIVANDDRSTEFGQDERNGLNFIGKKDKVSRFSMSNDSDGFQEHLKRTGYAGFKSRNDAVKGNINKDLPSSKDPQQNGSDIMYKIQEIAQMSYHRQSEPDNQQINFVTGSSQSNSGLEKNRSCIVLLEQARQQSRAQEAKERQANQEALDGLDKILNSQNIDQKISIEENIKNLKTYQEYHEKLESPENEKISDMILKQAQHQDQYIKDLKDGKNQAINTEDLKKIHSSIIEKEMGQCFDRNYMKNLSLSYAEQQKKSLNLTHLYNKKYSYRPKLPQLSMSNETIQNSLQISQKIQFKGMRLEKLTHQNQSMPEAEVLVPLADKFKQLTGSQNNIDSLQPSLITNQSLSIEEQLDAKAEGKVYQSNFEINQKDRHLLTKQYSIDYGSKSRYGKTNQLQPINQMVPRSKFQLIQPKGQELQQTKSYCTNKTNLNLKQKSMTSRGGISTSIPAKNRPRVNLPNLNLVLKTDRQIRPSEQSKNLTKILAHNNFNSLTMTKNQELIQKYQNPQLQISAPEHNPPQFTDKSLATIPPIQQESQPDDNNYTPVVKIKSALGQRKCQLVGPTQKYDDGGDMLIEEEPATVSGPEDAKGGDPDLIAQERFQSYTILGKF